MASARDLVTLTRKMGYRRDEEASGARRKEPIVATSERQPTDEDRDADDRRVEEEDRESFPASDPPSDWAGRDRS